jgi:hypothetical protein
MLMREDIKAAIEALRLSAENGWRQLNCWKCCK